MKIFLHLTTATIAIVFALTMIAGCGGGGSKSALLIPNALFVLPEYISPPNGPWGIPKGTTPESYTSPVGAYSFFVTTGMGEPSDQSGRTYRLNVTQVTETGVFVRYIVPNGDGNYDLSPAGYYQCEVFVTPSAPPAPLVAVCWVQTGDFPLESM